MEWNVLAAVLCFFCWKSAKAFVVELAQSEHEWMDWIWEKVPQERELRGQRVAVFLGPRELVVTLLMSILIPPHMVVTHTKKSLLSEYIQGSEEGLWKRRERYIHYRRNKDVLTLLRNRDDRITLMWCWLHNEGTAVRKYYLPETSHNTTQPMPVEVIYGI